MLLAVFAGRNCAHRHRQSTGFVPAETALRAGHVKRMAAAILSVLIASSQRFLPQERIAKSAANPAVYRESDRSNRAGPTEVATTTSRAFRACRPRRRAALGRTPVWFA